MSGEMTQAMSESVGHRPMTALQCAQCFALDMAGLRNLREIANYIRACDIGDSLKAEWLAALQVAMKAEA